MKIDLNADLGEGCGSDDALLALVSSANVACGIHAGDAVTVDQTVRWALERGAAIGAHPSFPDRENFGRTRMDLEPEVVYAHVLYQIGAIGALVRARGGRLAHVKAHGELYNQATREPVLADAIVAAVADFDPSLAVFGLANGELIEAAKRRGLTAVEEVFLDRGYDDQGYLVKRGTPGALIEDETEAVERTLEMIRDGVVTSVNGRKIKINAQTVCLHGDGAHALEFANAIRRRLAAEKIEVGAAWAPHGSRLTEGRVQK
jgi:UPF0271 protein